MGDNQDSIDEEGRKEVCTVEIGVCAKPRLMPSGHLACHFVTSPIKVIASGNKR